MGRRVPIAYRGFWDVPRVFLARHEGLTFLFDCAFDQQMDDYPEVYKVFLLPDLRDDDLPADWTTLRERALSHLADVPVTEVLFDPTRRQTMDSGVLDNLLCAAAAYAAGRRH